MNKCILFFLLLIQSSCATIKTVKFDDQNFTKKKPNEYIVLIPRDYKRIKKGVYPNTIHQYQFSNGATVYISLDITYVDSPNQENWSVCSKPEIAYKCEQGVQQNGLLWREIMRHRRIVLGYFDVPIEDKAKFDAILQSLKKIE